MDYSGTPGVRPSNIEKNESYNGGGLLLEMISSMKKHFLFNKAWSDNGGGLIPGGLIPEVSLFIYLLHQCGYQC